MPKSDYNSDVQSECNCKGVCTPFKQVGHGSEFYTDITISHKKSSKHKHLVNQYLSSLAKSL